MHDHLLTRRVATGFSLGLLLPLIAAPRSATAQDPAGPPAGQPRIDVEPKTVRLGEVYVGDAGYGELTIRNTGDAPLIISKIEKSCGCTATFMAEEDKIIQPGAESKLKVELRPNKTQSGTDVFTKIITIVSNDPYKSNLRVGVECIAKIGVEANPSNLLIDEPGLKVGESRTMEVEVASANAEPFQITDVEIPENAALTVNYDKETKQISHKLSVQIGPVNEAANVTANLKIHTDHSRTKMVNVYVLAKVQRLVTVTPSYLNLGEVDPGAVVEQQVQLKTEGERRIESLEIEVQRHELQVTATRVPDSATDWVLRFNIPSSLAGKKIIAPLVIRTNIKEAGELKANVSFRVNSLPAPPAGT
jgi:hypothetical protein